MKNSPFKSIPPHNAGPEKCFPRCWEPQPGPRAAPAAAASVHVLTVSPRPGEAQKLHKQDAAGLTAQQRPPGTRWRRPSGTFRLRCHGNKWPQEFAGVGVHVSVHQPTSSREPIRSRRAQLTPPRSSEETNGPPPSPSKPRPAKVSVGSAGHRVAKVVHPPTGGCTHRRVDTAAGRAPSAGRSPPLFEAPGPSPPA